MKLPCYVIRELTADAWRCSTCEHRAETGLDVVMTCPRYRESQAAPASSSGSATPTQENESARKERTALVDDQAHYEFEAGAA